MSDTTKAACTASSYATMNGKNFGKSNSEFGSLFIRAMVQSDRYWITPTASNLMGTGTGLVLEIRPVPDKQTRYFNCLWVEKVTQCADPSMMYAGIHDTKRPGTEPFYVVGRKRNKTLEGEIVTFLDHLDEEDDFGDCDDLTAKDLLRRCLARMLDQ